MEPDVGVAIASIDTAREQIIYRKIWEEQGCKYEPGAIVKLPFRCWGCGELSRDFLMITGDGVCMCAGCFYRWPTMAASTVDELATLRLRIASLAVGDRIDSAAAARIVAEYIT